MPDARMAHARLAVRSAPQGSTPGLGWTGREVPGRGTPGILGVDGNCSIPKHCLRTGSGHHDDFLRVHHFVCEGVDEAKIDFLSRRREGDGEYIEHDATLGPLEVGAQCFQLDQTPASKGVRNSIPAVIMYLADLTSGCCFRNP